MNNAYARRLLKNGSLIPEDLEGYRQQTRAFEEKFGRPMGPDDPFFFDPGAETPQFRSPGDAPYAIDLLARLMAQANVDPAVIYAFRRTGGLLPNHSAFVTARELEEWNAAVEEYRGIFGGR